MTKSIGFLSALLMLGIFPLKAIAEPSVSLNGNRFSISGQLIPSGCFAQLMTQLNGDNIIASIFLTRPSLRGCVDANDPYPSGNEDRVSIEARELDKNLFGVKVCESVDGSLGASCDSILIKFENRDYFVGEKSKPVWVVTKTGDWIKTDYRSKK